ncbi:hypothetical protein [Rhodoblastus sp.]|uniref:hypothetical protein n=1 Tax=Rhodoblastus sp. TaxID=1962975 RepID=UPI003F952C68
MKAYRTAARLYGTEVERRIYCVDPALSARRVEAFFDLNNICHPGVENCRHARLRLDVIRSKLAAAGVQWTMGFSHFMSPPLKIALRKAGIQPVETLENADTQLAEAARKRLAGGLDRLILGTGDHFGCDLAAIANACGTEVHVWGRSGRISRHLAAMATKVVILDDYLFTPAAAPLPANCHELRLAA